MSDLEEVKRVLGEVLYCCQHPEPVGPWLTLRKISKKTTDALAMLRPNMVLMSEDDLLDTLKLAAKLGMNEAFASIGLKLKSPAEEPGCQLSDAVGGTEELDIATTEQLIERGLVCPICGHDKTWHKCELCGCHQRDVRYAIAEEPDHLSTSEVVAILKPPTEEPERVGKGTPWDTGDARVNELLDQGCELGEALDQAAKDRKKEDE